LRASGFEACLSRSLPAASFAANFEKLIDSTPDGRKRVAAAREQMKAIRAQIAAKQAKTAQHA